MILEKAFFICFYLREGSRHFSSAVIRGRDVVIFDTADLSTPDDATITILHEASHSFLGHSKSGLAKTLEESMRQEDEAWAQVRHWLPGRFHPRIDQVESQGGGTRGPLSPDRFRAVDDQGNV